MLRKILGELKKTEYSDSLFFHLKDLCEESKRILNRNDVSTKEGIEMVKYISEIRSLLAELASHEKMKRGNKRRLRSIQYLKECYLDLEYTVKERTGSLKG